LPRPLARQSTGVRQCFRERIDRTLDFWLLNQRGRATYRIINKDLDFGRRKPGKKSVIERSPYVVL